MTEQIIRFNYNASLNDWMELSNKVAYAFTDSNATQETRM